MVVTQCGKLMKGPGQIGFYELPPTISQIIKKYDFS